MAEKQNAGMEPLLHPFDYYTVQPTTYRRRVTLSPRITTPHSAVSTPLFGGDEPSQRLRHK